MFQGAVLPVDLAIVTIFRQIAGIVTPAFLASLFKLLLISAVISIVAASDAAGITICGVSTLAIIVVDVVPILISCSV